MDQLSTQTINIANDCKVEIRCVTTFQHGKDGLKLWEAGIVLTRYLYYNIIQKLTKQDLVVDLGTGVGISGIVMAKQCRVIMTDYNEETLRNTWHNVLLNQTQCTIIPLDWREYHKITFQCNILIGSDIVYQGAPLYELYSTVTKLLSKGGKFYLIIPSERGQTQKFLDIMKQDEQYEIEIEELVDQKYYEKCLESEEQSDKIYPGLKKLRFCMYIFTKKY